MRENRFPRTIFTGDGWSVEERGVRAFWLNLRAASGRWREVRLAATREGAALREAVGVRAAGFVADMFADGRGDQEQARLF